MTDPITEARSDAFNQAAAEIEARADSAISMAAARDLLDVAHRMRALALGREPDDHLADCAMINCAEPADHVAGGRLVCRFHSVG